MPRSLEIALQRDSSSGGDETCSRCPCFQPSVLPYPVSFPFLHGSMIQDSSGLAATVDQHVIKIGHGGTRQASRLKQSHSIRSIKKVLPAVMVSKVMALSSLHGVFPLMKPTRITSAQLLNCLKDKLLIEQGLAATVDQHAIKIGHGGTLDSAASGVLAVGIGGGCSKLKCFLSGEKAYIAKCQLGVATDTYNSYGKITMEKPYVHITEKLVREKLGQFSGRIKQVPPAYSALKKDGKRYSDWAREGVNLEIHARVVHCYELQIKDFTPPFLTLAIVSGPGFYVRSLIHDLGHALESCAHVCDLQRTRQGPFTLHHALHEHQWTADTIASSIAKHRGATSSWLAQMMSLQHTVASFVQRLLASSTFYLGKKWKQESE